MWGLWWVWIVAGFSLAVLEVLAPGFIFLGFAIGAVATGVLVGFGVTGSLPLLLLIFAVLSFVAWFVLKRVFGRADSEIKLWDRDVNDN